MEPVKVIMVISFVFAAKCNCGRLIEKPVGSTVLLPCNIGPYQSKNSTLNYFWWYNNKLMFGSGYKPIDIGLRNVQITLVNNTISNLQIDCLSTINKGNYTCKIGSDVLSNFNVKVTGVTNLTVTSAIFNSNISWTCCFQGNHVWKFNGSIIFAETFQPDDIGLNNVYGVTINQTFTRLYVEGVSMRNAGEYSCLVGGINELKYILRVHDIRLFLSIDGRNASEVQHLLSGVKYNIECSVLGVLGEKNYEISMSVSSHVNYRKDKLHNTTVGFNTAVITAALPSVMEQSLLLCVVYDENGSEFGEERMVLDVYVVPQLIIQKGGRNLSGTYKADIGEILELKCVAFASRPAVSLQWKSTNENNLTFTQTFSNQNEFHTSTVNLESHLKIVVEKSMILTCCSRGMGRFHALEAELKVEADGWNEILYIVVAGGISIVAVVLICISQMRLRLQRQRRENAELFALSIWQNTTSSVPNGDTDVSMVTFGTSKDEMNITDEPVDGFTTNDGAISSQSVTLLSRLNDGDCKEYWLGRYASNDNHQNCICETVSEKAQMKDAYNFLSLIKRLRCLPNHSNVVTYLGSSTEEVPYYVYREYVDNGTLRDFLLRNYQSHQGGGGLSTDAASDVFNQTKPHPITFARDVAEAMHFLQNQQFNHPALSANKVLIDYTLICKLYDFWPSELTTERAANLMNSNICLLNLKEIPYGEYINRSNPPTGWFSPETIFLGQYDTLSDVWAYGVFLWELFSLGEIPYQFKSTKEIEEEIRSMVLLPQPQMCPGAVYSIMLSTWNKHRENRPLFADVIHQIHYLQENFVSFKETEIADEWNEWDEWNKDYFSLEPEQHNNCQYSVPFKQSVHI